MGLFCFCVVSLCYVQWGQVILLYSFESPLWGSLLNISFLLPIKNDILSIIVFDVISLFTILIDYLMLFSEVLDIQNVVQKKGKSFLDEQFGIILSHI